MIALIGCQTGCERGRPLTSTRHYAELPLRNKELLKHQLEALDGFTKVLILHDGHASLGSMLDEAYGHLEIEYIEKESEADLTQVDLFLPGDLLPRAQMKQASKPVLILGQEDSEESASLKKLLAAAKIAHKEQVIDALRINYPWELLTANALLLKEAKRSISNDAVIEEHVTIKGEVIIGRNTVVKAGSYLEGPLIIGENCVIGPMAHLRPDTSIGDDCVIGKTEVFDCVIMRATVSKHAAYLGHSVLCEDVNVGAFTVTADYRHDAREHIVLVGGERVPSKRRKVGAFIGDHARLGISTSIYPGRKIAANATTLPGEIVTQDKEAS